MMKRLAIERSVRRGSDNRHASGLPRPIRDRSDGAGPSRDRSNERSACGRPDPWSL